MRAMWCAAALVAVGLATPVVADAASTLSATPTMVRVGDVITVTGSACPTPNTITFVAMQTMPEWLPKGTPPFVPLGPGTISLDQTATGVSFEVTAAEARTTRFFQVDCSDGTSTLTTVGAAVMPPVGAFWWTWNSYGTFTAEPGFEFFFGARTMDCAVGTTAEAWILAPDGLAAIGPLPTEVDGNGGMLYDIPIPASFADGTYSGRIQCTGPGGLITNDAAITIGVPAVTPPPMPPTGGGDLWRAAALITLFGIAARQLSRRGTRSAR